MVELKTYSSIGKRWGKDRFFYPCFQTQNLNRDKASLRDLKRIPDTQGFFTSCFWDHPGQEPGNMAGGRADDR